jgi:hypothetical protein
MGEEAWSMICAIQRESLTLIFTGHEIRSGAVSDENQHARKQQPAKISRSLSNLKAIDGLHNDFSAPIEPHNVEFSFYLAHFTVDLHVDSQVRKVGEKIFEIFFDANFEISIGAAGWDADGPVDVGETRRSIPTLEGESGQHSEFKAVNVYEHRQSCF